MNVKETDHGYKKLMRAVKEAPKVVQVGIFAAEGNQEAAGTKNGTTVLDVAYWNEFGLGVPERSFLREYVDENHDRIYEMLQVLAKGILAGKYTQVQGLELLGLKIEGEIKQRISNGILPENAQSTIDRKGSDTPLIDTGQLRSSITSAVKS